MMNTRPDEVGGGADLEGGAEGVGVALEGDGHDVDPLRLGLVPRLFRVISRLNEETIWLTAA